MKLKRLFCLLAIVSLPSLATLIEAASKGDLNGVLSEIQKHLNSPDTLKTPLETQDFYGHTALQHAVYHGHTEIVQTLLEAGADFRLIGRPEYEQPIQVAIRRGHTSIITLLVSRGVSIQTTFQQGYGLLHIAALYGQRESIQTLIQLGADPSGTDAFSRTPTDLAPETQRELIAQVIRDASSSRQVPGALGTSFGASWGPGVTSPTQISNPNTHPAVPCSKATKKRGRI